MSQFVFGSGILFGTPTQDAAGNPIVNPSPIEFGTLQDVSLDLSFDTKMLYGNKQFPVAVGRGKGKISGKAKVATLSGFMINSLFFGQSLLSGITAANYDTTGTVIATSLTPAIPGSGTWTRDLGVKDANGLTMRRVASGPTTGQYSVSAGVYTFAAADVGKLAFINFMYDAASTSAVKSNVMNLPMGYAPTFATDLYMPYLGKQLVISAPNAISSKFSIATKQDDFMVPEFDFDCFADATGRILTYGMTDN